MDLQYLTATNPSNSTVPFPPALSHIIGIYCITFDVISNIMILLLIIYRRYKKQGVTNYHDAIFSQLYYFCIAMVLFRDLSRLLSFFNPAKVSEDWATNILFLLLSSAFLGTVWISLMLNDISINIILLLSFLAAIQRLITIYSPKYRHLITGKSLPYPSLMLWFLMLHYFWMIRANCLIDNCSYQLNLVIVIYRVFFATGILVTILTYFHIYQLISQLTTEDYYQKKHLLFQFVSIYTILTLYTSFRFLLDAMGWLQNNVFASEVIMILGGSIVSSWIPIVVSLSYIASQDSLRNWFIQIFQLVITEISS